nr:P1 family peptidase [Pelistega indica]
MMNVFNSTINESTPPTIGILPSGPNNQITDIAGVSVGQVTLQEGSIQTGVTVITPHAGDIFTEKVAAGVSIINGFGKSIGLIQLEELGVIETPIALTNTFAVPIIAQAQIKQAIQQHPQIGREWATVNPLVLECNDGYLNDLHAFAIEEKHYHQAHALQSNHVQQGSVGAGRGMRSFGLKGGIGTASRYSHPDDKESRYLVGALVLSNFGSLPYLQIGDSPLGKIITQLEKQQEVSVDKGSIIIVLATRCPSRC